MKPVFNNCKFIVNFKRETGCAKMLGLLVGGDMPTADAYGNTANVDKVASPDNLSYSEEMRTLFIGEDSSKHTNNYVWAYNVDTKQLTRILSNPAGAESTGLLATGDRIKQAIKAVWFPLK